MTSSPRTGGAAADGSAPANHAMHPVLRRAVGGLGAAGLAAAAACWADPAGVGRRLGLAAAGPLGLASLRADLGGFFGVAGGFALWAAVRDAPGAVAPALALMAAALLGRMLGLVLDPPPAADPGPAALELAICVVLAAALSGARRTR